MNAMSTSPIFQTTFLVPNIHCPSCITNIESALSTLEPKPTAVSHSIIAHSIKITHPSELPVALLCLTLQEAGYDIDSIHADPRSTQDYVVDTHGFNLGQHGQSFAMSSWAISGFGIPLQDEQEQSRKRKRHIENCDQCKSRSDVEAVLVADVKPRLGSSSISSFSPEHKDEKTDIEVVAPVLMADSWKAVYSIGGMTCSSCSSAITKTLQEIQWVRKVEVNLVSNSATVIFEGKDKLECIKEAIEDLGYEAKLDEVNGVASEAVPNRQRKVAIYIDGIYCEHCPPKIGRALAALDGDVTIDAMPTLKRPILNVTYSPQVPNLSIRQILACIREEDPAFEPTIHHPMTVEKRSQLMQSRERHHILMRLALTAITAIPTFIIGIVYMDLVSTNYTSSQYLMYPVHGVARAEWALFVLATPAYFFAADLFHRRTIKEIRALWRLGSPTPLLKRFIRFGSMNMLVSLGTTIAYISSIAILITSAIHSDMDLNNTKDYYFDSVVFLTMFLLAGRYMEAYSKGKTGDAVSDLGRLRPATALLIDEVADNTTEDKSSPPQQISVDLLEVGDMVKVPHGSSPPCDGVILTGSTTFNESSLTGESKAITKAIGDPVFAGTINQGSAITIRITGASGNSMLDQIIKVIREGQTRRAPVERIADIITGHFVPIVTFIAILTWIIWLSLGLSGMLPASYLDTKIGGWLYWSLQFAIAVFVVACPCGIGLAAPTALFVGGGLAAKHGILVKGGGEAFQEASRVDCVVFDKTGTLTVGGEPRVTDSELLKTDIDEDLIMSMMRRLEEDSSHPVAKAVVGFCQGRKAKHVDLLETNEIPGKGMHGVFSMPSNDNGSVTNDDKLEMLIGNQSLMTSNSITLSRTILTTLQTWTSSAKSIVLIATRLIPSQTSSRQPLTWTLSAVLAVSDPIRPEAPSVIRSLQNRNIAVWMLSGDNASTARAVGKQLGIPAENIIAGVLPHEKAAKIRYLQRSLPSRGTERGFLSPFSRKTVTNTVTATSTSNSTPRRAIIAMIGDGINDAPALSTADVSIAVSSSSAIALSSASFILLTPNLTSLLTLLDLSAVVFNRIKLNFAWAIIYNLIGLPLAAGVLYPLTTGGKHVRLSPVWAALAMALSSVSVVGSSLALRVKVGGVGFRATRLEDYERGKRWR